MQPRNSKPSAVYGDIAKRYAQRLPHTDEDIRAALETDCAEGDENRSTWKQMLHENENAAKQIVREEFLQQSSDTLTNLIALEQLEDHPEFALPPLRHGRVYVALELLDVYEKEVLKTESEIPCLWDKVQYLYGVLVEIRLRAEEIKKPVRADLESRLSSNGGFVSKAELLHEIHERLSYRLEQRLDFALEAKRLGLFSYREAALPASGAPVAEPITWKGTDHQLAYLLRCLNDAGMIQGNGNAYWKAAASAFCRPDGSRYNPERLRTTAGKGAPNTEADTIERTVTEARRLGDGR